MRYNVCIIGGGAAGLAAAASLDDGISVCVVEKNRIPGRKILATGGGRCNLTNEACEEKQLTMDFFACLGMKFCRDSEGRYYPYSEKASDVVDILTSGIGENTDFYFESQAASVECSNKDGDTGFLVKCHGDGKQAIEADCVIISPGGKAAPQYGSTGDGYAFASGFGHKVNRLYPILAGICCDREDFDFSEVKGVRAKAAVKLLKDGKPVEGAYQTGEVQFTEYGLSGICIFNLTPFVRAENGEDFRDAVKRYSISADFAPDFSEDELRYRQDWFGIVTKKLSDRINGADIKNVVFDVTGVRGWKDAQCTGGGVSTDEIDSNTMESKLIPGLYFAGEILDIQGPCGGFNLQNAWETGIKAAKAINRRLLKYGL